MSSQQLREPCHCAECRQAGVDALESVVNTKTGEALHGYPLKRWHAARDKFLATARKIAGTDKGTHGTD